MRRATIKRLDRLLGPLALGAVSSVASLFVGRHDPHTFIVTKLIGLGDSLLMLPVLHLLRRTWPEAKVVAVVTPVTKPLFIGRPEVDEIICYDVLGGDGGLRGLLRLACRLRSLQAGTYLDFEHYFFGTPFLGMFAGASNRVGLYHSETKKRQLLFTHPVYYDEQIHVLELYYRIYCAACQALGKMPLAEVELYEYRLTLPVGASEQVRKWRERCSVNKPMIGLHPGCGASGQFRRWPTEHFVALARRVLEAGRHAVVLTGSGEELPLLREIQLTVGHPDCHLGLGFDFAGFLALLGSLSVYVTNDTGPMHIAPWLDTPTVGLFGPNTPARYGPRLPHSRALYSQITCSPCIEIHRGLVPADCTNSEWGACMRVLSVDEVWNAVQDLLASYGSSIRGGMG